MSPNDTTNPTPVRDKREVEEFEIEEFSTTTSRRSKSSTNTINSSFTTLSSFDPAAEYTETTYEWGTAFTTVSTFDTEHNTTEISTKAMMETTTANIDASKVGFLYYSPN